MMQIGAQLYTVRERMENKKDILEGLKRVADMGYRCVQVSGIGKKQAMPPEELREACDALSLKIVITHNDPERLLYDTDAVIRENKIMGSQYLGIGSMPERYRNADWIDHFAKDYRDIAKKIADNGMLFMYHNHQLEFESLDGRLMMEHLLEDFPADEMGITFDIFWALVGGCDVYQWMDILKDRIHCVHMKDMSVRNRERIMKPVLEGNMNYGAIFQALEKTCCQYMMVEQDICEGSPYDCLKRSYDNIAKFGYR